MNAKTLGGWPLILGALSCTGHMDVGPMTAEMGGTGGAAVVGVGGMSGTGGAAVVGVGGMSGAVQMCIPAAEVVTPPFAPGCSATCGTPAGDVQPLTSVDAAYAVMEGRWEFCDAAWQQAVAAPPDAIGLEFTPASREPTDNGSTVGGKMYYLVAGAFGPERGRGFAYQMTYDISPEGSSFQINLHPAPNSGFAIRIRYSPCPNELEVLVSYADKPATMVRFATCGGG